MVYQINREHLYCKYYDLLTNMCGVRSREVERRPCNHEVPSSSPGSGSQLWDFSLAHTRREYWCSSQEAESREISISCKNLFLNRCKINMFKLNIHADFTTVWDSCIETVELRVYIALGEISTRVTSFETNSSKPRKQWISELNIVEFALNLKICLVPQL